MHLDPLRRQVFLDCGSGMDRGVVPVHLQVLGRHDRPLCLENFQEPCQGLLDVFGVHSFSLGDVVHVDDTLHVKGDKYHLLGPGRMDFRFSGAWLTLLDPLL
jgi:hypothetical protein